MGEHLEEKQRKIFFPLSVSYDMDSERRKAAKVKWIVNGFVLITPSIHVATNV